MKHNIDEEKLIKINNNYDNLCLFYALELARVYEKDYSSDKKMTTKQFFDLKNSPNRQRMLIDDLLSSTQINKSLLEYDAETFCPIVEDYWARKYGPNLFKVFIFSEYG